MSLMRDSGLDIKQCISLHCDVDLHAMHDIKVRHINVCDNMSIENKDFARTIS